LISDTRRPLIRPAGVPLSDAYRVLDHGEHAVKVRRHAWADLAFLAHLGPWMISADTESAYRAAEVGSAVDDRSTLASAHSRTRAVEATNTMPMKPRLVAVAKWPPPTLPLSPTLGASHHQLRSL
jgi:hypothetical protein